MEIVTTADGSLSLRHDILGELYHSDRGAVGEALHVFIEAGFDFKCKQMAETNFTVGDHAFAPKDCISVLEIGFGSGLNAWLTLKKSEELGAKIDYHAIELYPIEAKIASELNYTDDELFVGMHLAQSGIATDISANFTLTKHHCDLLRFDFTPLEGKFDVVFFDAFAPDSQPELWSAEMFKRIYGSMGSGGVLTTYTAKGVVKQAIREAGFSLERLVGALGKRHMLRAIKKL